MTKKSIKVISVIMFVILAVGCCFTGCERHLDVKDASVSDLLVALQKEYPDAHLYTGNYYNKEGKISIHDLTLILLTKSENSGMCIGPFVTDEDIKAHPEQFSKTKAFQLEMKLHTRYASGISDLFQAVRFYSKRVKQDCEENIKETALHCFLQFYFQNPQNLFRICRLLKQAR